MVDIATIRECNTRFTNEHHKNLICVFAGATAGIGAGTIERMAIMLDSPTFYVLGRSETKFADQRAKLQSLNPGCKIIFLEAEFSLLSSVDAACERIFAAERKVDLVYMSAGMMPLNNPVYTKERLEICFAISYYSRVRLTHNLLPLLRNSPQARVLSVLNGGKEKTMVEDDLGLEREWSTFGTINNTTTMMSLAFDHLAAHDKNQNITFMHAYPGWVSTGIFERLQAPEASGLAWKATLAFIRGFTAVVMGIFAISTEESGERQAFQLTDARYGAGAKLIGYLSDEVAAPAVLQRYREEGWPQKVWDYTAGVFERVLS